MTMDPERCPTMAGTAALTVCHVPVRSMSMTACQFSRLSSHAFPVKPVMPAFALTMSSRPKRSSPGGDCRSELVLVPHVGMYRQGLPARGLD